MQKTTMSDPTIIAPNSNGDESLSSTAAFLSAQVAEYKTITETMKLTRSNDELDTDVIAMLVGIMTDPHSLESNKFSLSGNLDLINGLLPIEQILQPSFFSTVKLPFHLLCNCLELLLTKPIKLEEMSQVQLTADESEESLTLRVDLVSPARWRFFARFG